MQQQFSPVFVSLWRKNLEMQDVYFISGLGVNYHAFDYLHLDENIKPHFIEWKIPEKDETLSHYAARMAEAINCNKAFSLVGLSFGGIVVQEMNRYVQPKQTILISSIKSRREMPKLMKFSAKTRAHKAIPSSFLTSGTLFSYSFFKRLYNRELHELNRFFTHRDPSYLKWSIDQIVNWDGVIKSQNLTQLHGTKDRVFPVDYIKGAKLIEGGTHLMIIQKARAISTHINRILNSRIETQSPMFK